MVKGKSEKVCTTFCTPSALLFTVAFARPVQQVVNNAKRLEAATFNCIEQECAVKCGKFADGTIMFPSKALEKACVEVCARAACGIL